MSKAYENVLRALENVNGEEYVRDDEPKQVRCPAHDDSHASLSVAVGKDGRVLLDCKGGCETTSVVTALGLTMPDLFESPRQVMSTADNVVYQYFDRNGVLKHEKVRYPGKKFIQRRPDGNGGHVWGFKRGWYKQKGGGWKYVKDGEASDKPPSEDAMWFPEAELILYHEQQISTAIEEDKTVFFVEGEKDVDNAAARNIVATTITGGANGTWVARYSAPLTGARVVVIPDDDKAGHAHAHRVCRELSNVAKEIRFLNLPKLQDDQNDLSDWFEAGGTADELLRLSEAVPVWDDPEKPRILDEFPDVIKRPLTLIDGHGYLTTWIPIAIGSESHQEMVVLRDDGTLYAARPLPGALPFADLELQVDLPHIPPSNRVMTGRAVKKYLAGSRPDAKQVFEQVCDIIDHFMDFSRSLGSQEDLAVLTTLYIMSTYFLDAFNVIGYLWPNGLWGSGKTQFLAVVTELAYLGQLILAGGSYATLRDLADYGATLAFDDAENIMDLGQSDPDKRALFLAGYRKGTYVTLKEQRGDRWETRYIHAFCPRLFSAIRMPDSVLASRTIMIPLIRSSNSSKSKTDPLDTGAWPHDRRLLVDELHALGLTHIATVREYYGKAVSRAKLQGRDLEPWMGIFTMSLWLQEEHGMEGLFDRMENLALKYQTERATLEPDNPVRIVIHALQNMFADQASDSLEFETSALCAEVNRIAVDREIVVANEDYTSAKKLGKLLAQQRLRKGQRSARRKKWLITRSDLTAMAISYGMPIEQEEVPSCRECQECREDSVEESNETSLSEVA